MNNATTPMHIIQPQQDLLRDLLHKRLRHAPALMALDEAQQILAEDLEDHADVSAVRALVSEVVEEGDDVGSAGVGLGGRRGGVGVGWGGGNGGSGGGDEALEELDLV